MDPSHDSARICQMLSELDCSVVINSDICKKLSLLLVRLAKNKSKLYYLNEMKTQNKIPPHLLRPILNLENKFSLHFLNNRRYNNQFFTNLSNRTLKLDIQQAQWLIKGTETKINKLLNENNIRFTINDCSTHHIFVTLLNKLNSKISQKTKKSIKFKNNNPYMKKLPDTIFKTTIVSYNIKCSEIQNEKTHPKSAMSTYTNYFKNNLTVNLTNKTIEPDILNCLSLGPNFALPTNRINKGNTIETIAAIESCINNSNTPDNQKNALRNRISSTIDKFINKNKIPAYKNNVLTNQIQMDFKKTRNWTVNNRDIIVAKTDKTKQTIIYNKAEYNQKMISHLNNKESYKKISNDPTVDINLNIKQYNSKLLNHKYIDKLTYNKITNNNPICPRIYGLVKAHKENFPIRPIVNGYESPMYNLSKWLNPTLNVLSRNNPFDIKNSFKLRDKLKEIKLNNNDTLISLDVVSLYPNIPLDYFYKLIDKNFETLIKPHTCIKDINLYKEGLKLCLNNSVFSYENQYYKQTFGVPMGGCLSTNVAGIVMNEIISTALGKLKNKPKMIVKYIDDLLLIVNKDDTQHILNTFNSIHERIQFTVENEHNRSLNFLDITIVRDDCNLLTKWYKKPIASNRLVNAFSNHPKHMKNNTIKNFINRALNLTDKSFKTEIEKEIVTILTENLYSKKYIINCLKNVKNTNKNTNNNKPLKKTLIKTNRNEKTNNSTEKNIHQNNKLKQTTLSQFFDKQYSSTPTQPTTKKDEGKSNKNKIFLSVPYIKGLSEQIKKLLKDYDFHDIKIADKPINKLNTSIYSQLKDSIPKEKKTCVVYQVDCGDCDKIYIGQTKQYIKTRISQHKSTTVSTKKSQNTKTALAKHSINTRHTFNFTDVKILDKETHRRKRELKEALHICLNSQTVVNDKSDMHNLNHFYANTLHSLKKS